MPLARARRLRAGVVLSIAGLLLAWCIGPPVVAADPARFLGIPLVSIGPTSKGLRDVQRWLEMAGREVVPDLVWLEANRRRWPPRLRRVWRRDCSADARCLAAAARAVRSDALVVGEVGAIRDAYAVYLTLVGRDGRRIRSAHAVIERGVLAPDRSRRLLLRLLAPDQYRGSMRVRVDVADAWIYLDGQRVGQGPEVVVDRLAVGTHALRVTHEAFHDQVRFVRVHYDQRVEVETRLAAYPVRAPDGATVMAMATLRGRDLPWYRRWWAVAGFGVVIAAATATVVALVPHRVARDQVATVIPP